MPLVARHTMSTSAVPQSSADATNHGPMSAVCQNSCAGARLKIHAVTLCTRMATMSATTLMARIAVCDMRPASARRYAHR